MRQRTHGRKRNEGEMEGKEKREESGKPFLYLDGQRHVIFIKVLGTNATRRKEIEEMKPQERKKEESGKLQKE